MERKCKICGEVKDITKFGKTTNGYRTHKCKSCLRKYAREYNVKLKREVLSHYSKDVKCQSCGYDDIRALSIDHINGGGEKHRALINTKMYLWLRRNNYPDGYQVLCMNCNFIKSVEVDWKKLRKK